MVIPEISKIQASRLVKFGSVTVYKAKSVFCRLPRPQLQSYVTGDINLFLSPLTSFYHTTSWFHAVSLAPDSHLTSSICKPQETIRTEFLVLPDSSPSSSWFQTKTQLKSFTPVLTSSFLCFVIYRVIDFVCEQA